MSKTNPDKQNDTGTHCPICGKPTNSEHPHFPFCCKRCRQVDLSRWLGGQYLISRSIEQDDLEQTD